MRQALDIRQRARLRRAIYAKPTILALMLLFGFVVSGTWGMYQKHAIARDNLTKERLELGTLQAKEVALQSDIEHLSTERGVEEEIRSRYMVAKDGEGVIVISDDSANAVHTVTVTDPTGVGSSSE